MVNWELFSADGKYDVQITHGGKPVEGIKADRICVVEEDTKRWVDAYHIHKWFVDNVQNGQDDEKKYYIGHGNLQNLYDTCDQVITASKLVDGVVDAATADDTDHPHGVAQRAPGKVIEDPTVAKKLLPTRSDALFGSGDHDEKYLNDVKETRDWAAQLLADCNSGIVGENFYTSYWKGKLDA